MSANVKHTEILMRRLTVGGFKCYWKLFISGGFAHFCFSFMYLLCQEHEVRAFCYLKNKENVGGREKKEEKKKRSGACPPVC